MWNKFVNPFKYLPLRQAWCWGIAALILTSIFCWQVGLRMTSVTQINLLGDRLWAALCRQIIVWLLFAVILYVVGLVASRSKVRFVDVAAFNLFARIPMDLALLPEDWQQTLAAGGFEFASDAELFRMLENLDEFVADTEEMPLTEPFSYGE